MSALIETSGLTKCYKRGCEKIYAVDHIDLSVEKGEILSVIGESGSGKTTLINLLGCLDNPSSGSLILDGQAIFTDSKPLSEQTLTKIRRRYFGYVFQKFFLIPTLTVEENILLPTVFNRTLSIDEQRLSELTALLGIGHRRQHRPAELSGGEMQRVAIARALITSPRILIADEPTGNLDSKRADEIRNLLLRLNRETGINIILVTHSPEMASIAHRIIRLSDGRIIHD